MSRVSSDLLQLSLRVDVHITRLTVKCFVLQARWWFGRWNQFAFDSRTGKRLDGAHAAPGLEHRLVLGTWRLENRKQSGHNRNGWVWMRALCETITNHRNLYFQPQTREPLRRPPREMCVWGVTKLLRGSQRNTTTHGCCLMASFNFRFRLVLCPQKPSAD